MKFPQYRKLSDTAKYYRIDSYTQWEEVSFIGVQKIVRAYTATQLPERNFLLDILEQREGNVEIITEYEYINAKPA